MKPAKDEQVVVRAKGELYVGRFSVNANQVECVFGRSNWRLCFWSDVTEWAPVTLIPFKSKN